MANNNNGMKQNNYLAKVVAYIPADIVAAYVAASGALEQAKDTVPIDQVLWVVAGALLLLTPLWILVTARDAHTSHPAFRAVAGTVAFASWVFALGGPFAYLDWYQPVYGTLVLTFTTLLIPLAEMAMAQSFTRFSNGRLA
jgi:hypothetical protein